jgi:hypothetical protein
MDKKQRGEPNRVEAPVVEQVGDTWRDSVERHPAYAQISAARIGIGGPGLRLYGSDFQHRNCVRVVIQHSELSRSTSHDRHFTTGRIPIVEVFLSEAQWATFVSTLNVGDGTPCTLRLTEQDGYAPEIGAPTVTRTAQFAAEIKRTLSTAVEQLRAMAVAAKTEKQRHALDVLAGGIEANAAWIAGQFDKHAEETVEKAKIEIHAYATGVLQRAGLAALAGGAAPKLLEGADDGRE